MKIKCPCGAEFDPDHNIRLDFSGCYYEGDMPDTQITCPVCGKRESIYPW